MPLSLHTPRCVCSAQAALQTVTLGASSAATESQNGPSLWHVGQSAGGSNFTSAGVVDASIAYLKT